MDRSIRKLISSLAKRYALPPHVRMNDFFLTWEDRRRNRRDLPCGGNLRPAEANISCRMFDSGLRHLPVPRQLHVPGSASPAPATCRLQRAGSRRRQIAPDCPRRNRARTPNMISSWPTSSAYATTCTSARQRLHAHGFREAVQEGLPRCVLEQRPTLVNLSDTTSTADMLHTSAGGLHIINHFGGLEKLKGKKIAMSWAYSPSYSKPSPCRRASSA